MPLSFADLNSVNTIKKIGGSKEQQRHLENLGFVPGTVIVVVSKTNGNVLLLKIGRSVFTQISKNIWKENMQFQDHFQLHLRNWIKWLEVGYNTLKFQVSKGSWKNLVNGYAIKWDVLSLNNGKDQGLYTRILWN